MILVYSLLTENKERLVNDLVQHLRGDSRLYARLSRVELREAMKSLFDAYCEYLISGNPLKLRVVLGYWFKLGSARSMDSAALIKAPFGILPVVRGYLQSAYRDMSEQDRTSFNQAMKCVESYVSQMMGLCVEILAEQQTLPVLNKQPGMLRYAVLRG
jgi:hypothetical protein